MPTPLATTESRVDTDTDADADAGDGESSARRGALAVARRYAPSVGGSLPADRRATTTTVNYVLAVGIVSLLITGLLIAGGGVLDDQRQTAVRDQLETVGNRMAGELVAVDRLSRSGGGVNVTVDRPEQVGGSTYRAELVTGGGCPSPSCLELTATATDTTVTVPVGNRTPVTMTRDGDVWWVNSSRSAAGATASASADVELNVDPSIGVARNVDTSPPIGRAINIVNERPIAGFVYDPDSPGVGRTVSFRNDTRDIDGQVTNFSWDLDDDGSFEATGPNANTTSYTYTQPGKYDARLMITDDDGDTGNATKQVSVSGVVYQRDAVAVDLNGGSDPGTVNFSVINAFPDETGFDETVELEQLTVNPENDTDRLVEDGINYEVIADVPSSSERETLDGVPNGYAIDDTAGTDFELDELEVDRGETVEFTLSAFENGGSVMNASEETYEMTLKYRVDVGGTDELYYYRFTVRPAPPGTPPPATGPSPPTDGNVLFAVNSGGPATTIDGISYEADTNGDPSDYRDPGDSSGSTQKSLSVSNTTADLEELYQSERYDTSDNEMGYTFPTGDGRFKVTFRFAEIYFDASGSPSASGGTGSRVFDVTAEGETVRDDLDVYQEVGSETAYVVNYTVDVTDGDLDLGFVDEGANNPQVSAVEVRRAGYRQTDPDRVVVEAEGYTDQRDGVGSVSGDQWVTRGDGGSGSPGPASGEEYMLATPGDTTGVQSDSTDGPRLDYNVEFTDPGTYTVYARMASENGSSNSIHVALDGRTPASYSQDSGHDSPGSEETSNDWVWVDDSDDPSGATTIQVNSAGRHTIRVWARENGVKFDKLVFEKGGSAPSNTGPPVSSLRPPGPVAAPPPAPASGPPAALRTPARRTVVGVGTAPSPEVRP